MAVTTDAFSGGFAADTTTATGGHTIGAGSNRFLIVSVGIGDLNSNGAVVTSVTFGAANLTPVTSVTNDTVIDGIVVREELWRMVAPATGLDTITVTLDLAAHIVFRSGSFAGVDQTNPLGAASTTTRSGTSTYIDIPGTVSSSLVWDGSVAGAATLPAGITPGTGQTEHGENANGSDPTAMRSNASHAAGGAASLTISCATNGTTTVTSSALFGSVTVGMSVTGTGIPADTHVSAKASSSSITITRAATDSTTNDRIFIPTMSESAASSVSWAQVAVEIVTTAATVGAPSNRVMIGH